MLESRGDSQAPAKASLCDGFDPAGFRSTRGVTPRAPKTDSKLDHASGDEPLPESEGLVTRSSGTAIRTGTCAHQSGDWDV